MYFKVAQGDAFYNDHAKLTRGASQFLLENDAADVALLPGTDHVTVGSRAIDIETGNVYILSPTKGWLKYKGVAMID